MGAYPKVSQANNPRIAYAEFDFERMCQIVLLILGARCAYAGRNLPVGADGLAYMDVARSYARLDWYTAINGYWGPLYAWLLAIPIRLFHPGITYEFAIARGLNFILFAAALYTFSRFWRAAGEWSGRIDHEYTSLPVSSPYVWIGLGYLLFCVNFIWSVDTVNPDILVATIVFAIAEILFNLNASSQNIQRGVGTYIWLGILLAIGYYGKAILLYFAVFLLAAIVIQGYRARRLFGPITTALVFVVLIAPYVVMLSRQLGHFTAGDSGKLNYAWFVDGPETKTWEKDTSGGAPLPFYPGPIIFESPRVFGIPSIEGITYAPWYDATRFDRRSHPIFNLHNQLRQLAINLRYPREQLLGTGAALTVPLLIVVWYAPIASLRRFAATWFCTLPTAAVFGMYLLVHLVERFVIGFSLLLWGAAWAAVALSPDLRILARRAVLAGAFVFAAYSMPGLLHYVVSGRSESVTRDMTIAEALPRYGIVAGDAVASIGDGQEAYWAHFAGLPIVAEIWTIDSRQFWSSPTSVQHEALRAMADSGAKAAIWRSDSSRSCPSEWRSLPANSGCMISLR